MKNNYKEIWIVCYCIKFVYSNSYLYWISCFELYLLLIIFYSVLIRDFMSSTHHWIYYLGLFSVKFLIRIIFGSDQISFQIIQFGYKIRFSFIYFGSVFQPEPEFILHGLFDFFWVKLINL